MAGSRSGRRASCCGTGTIRSSPIPCSDDGWLTTSDKGRYSQGRLEVVGRADDVIMTGGEKVSPVEIEAMLAEHPLIDEAVVLGDRRR